MQFPQPIDYYSIDLPDDVVNEIQDLSVDSLKKLVAEIAFKISNPSASFEHDDFDIVTDEVIEDQLSGNDWIYFLQWVLEGLKQASN